MAISAGRLNRRISIQQRSTSQDSLGQPVETWTEVAEVWADCRSTNGLSFIKESMVADATSTMARYSFRIRYRTGLNESMRVVYDSVNYNIIAVMPDLHDRGHLDLACELVK